MQERSSLPHALDYGLPVVGLFLGVLALAWSFTSDLFRNSEGDLTGLAAAGICAALVLALVGFTINTKWRAAGLWFSLAALGHVATLQITFAGPTAHYQHLEPVSALLANEFVVFSAFLLLRLTAVIAGLAIYRKEIWGFVRSRFKWWQALLILAAFLLPSATVSEDVGFYVQEFLLSSTLHLVSLGNLILAAAAIPEKPGERILRIVNGIFGRGAAWEGTYRFGRSIKHVAIVAVFATVASSMLVVFSYEQHPHIPEEVTYLIHARMFAEGLITLPAPPVPEAFETYLMGIYGDVWYPVAPPGWPIILTAGTILGFPWLVNPVLTGLNVLLCYIFLKEIYPDPVSRLSSFLLAFSPWAIFLGMSVMNHTSTLTLALLGGIGIAFSRRTGSIAWAFVAGACVGFTSLIRPLDAVAIGLLLGIWAIGIGGLRIRFASLISFTSGTAILGGSGLYYNWLLTGDPLKIPVMEYLNSYFGPNANSYGFGADRGMGWSLDPNPGHGPIDALINSNLNVSTMSVDIFGWSIGGFLLVALFILRGRLKGPDGVMMGAILVVYVLYFFYYFAGGPEFSARYWYIVIVPMCALTARGIETLSRVLKEHFRTGEFNVRVTLVFLALFAVTVFIPWRAIDKYHNLRGMRPDIRQLAVNWENSNSLILIKLGNDAYMHPDFDSAMVYNPLDLNARAPVYAWDRHSINCWDRINCKEVTGLDTRRKLLEHYIDRDVWIVRSPSSTGKGYEIEAGPIEARELLEQESEANGQ